MKIYQPKDYKGNKLVSEATLASKNYATQGEVELKADQTYVDDELTKKADVSALEAHASDSTIHVTNEEKEKWNDTYSSSELDEKLASKAEQSDLEELNQKINDIPDLQGVEQTYDPASENAVSGKAVAEAIKDLATKDDLADKADQSAVDSLTTQLNNKADKTALDQAKQELQQEIATRTESMLHYKGSVSSYTNLEEKKAIAQTGDVWNVTDTDANYVWTGQDWDKLNERYDGLATKTELTTHTNNTTVHVQEGEREKWNDKYTKAEVDAKLTDKVTQTELQEGLDKKADTEDVEALQSTVDDLKEQGGVNEETLKTFATKDDLEQHETEADAKYATKDEVTQATGKVDGLESTVSSLETQVSDLETNKANATDLTNLTQRVTQHEQDALKGESTFTYIPLVSTDSDESEEVSCTRFQLANHLLTPGTISTLTLTDVQDASGYCTLFVSSDSTTWIKLASSSNIEGGTWTFENAILPADTHLRCVFTAEEISDGNSEGNKSVTVKKSAAGNTDKISSYNNSGEDMTGIVCATLTFKEETTETVEQHITDQSKHLTENEKRNLQTFFSGYDGSATLGEIEKKLDSTATDANFEELRQQLAKKADSQTVTELTNKVNKKAEQSAVDALQTELDNKASNTDLAQVQSDLANKASNAELKKVQDSLELKATTTALESAKFDLQEQIDNKADSSELELLQSKVETLEEATIEQTITGKETSQNAASAKAVADYVTGIKSGIETQIQDKVSTEDFNSALADKADKNQLEELQTTVGNKIGQAELTEALGDYVKSVDLEGQLESKADATEVTKLEESLNDKVSNDTLEQKLGDYVKSGDLTTDLENKADKTDLEKYALKTTVETLEGTVAGHTQSISDLTEQLEQKIDDSTLTEKLEPYVLQTAFTQHTNNETEKLHVTAAEKSSWAAKVDTTLLNETVNTAKTELEKKIPIVDKVYDSNSFPTSENAQSGITVKAALDKFHDEIVFEFTDGDISLEGYATTEELGKQKAELEGKITTAKNTADNAQTAADSAQSAVDTHIQDNDKHVTSTDKTKWNEKIDQSGLTSAINTAKTEITEAYQKEIKQAVGSVFKWKGTLANLEVLKAVEAPEIGDVYNITEEGGANYVYSGEAEENDGWDKLSENIEGFATTEALTTHENKSEVHFTGNEKSDWNNKITSNISGLSTLQAQVTAHVGNTNLHFDAEEKKTLQSDISGAKSDIKALQTKTDTTNSTLTSHIADVTVAHFNTGEKEEMQSSIHSLQSEILTKVSQEDIEGLVTDAELQEVDTKIQDLLDGIDHEWNTQESPTSEGLQTGKSVAGAVQEHENKSDIHVTAAEKQNWTTKEYVDSLTKGLASDGKITALSAQITEVETNLDNHKNDTDVHFENAEEKTKWTGKITANESSISSLSSEVQGVKTSLQDKAATSVTDGLASDIARIEESIPTVEQKYSAVSENAQSGKAVASALSTFKGTLDTELESYATTEALESQSTTLTESINTAKSEASTNLTAHINDAEKHPSQEQQESWDAKVDETKLNKAIEDNNATITSQLANKVDNEEFNKHKTDETIHLTQDEKEKLSDVITEAEVDTKLQNYTLTTILTQQLAQKVDNTELTKKLAEKVDNTALESALADKADDSALQAHIEEPDIHVTAKEKAGWNAKVETLALNSAIELAQTTLRGEISKKANTETVTELSGTVTTLDATVKDMKKSIDALEAGTVQIDNEYNPESEHAISGKGVAAALEKYATTETVNGLSTQVSGLQTSLSSKAESSRVDELEEQLSSKLDEAALTEKLGDYAKESEVTNLSSQLSTKASATDLTDHTEDDTIHFTEGEKTKLEGRVTAVETGLQGKASTSDLESIREELSSYLTTENAESTYAKSATVTALQTEVGKKANKTALETLQTTVDGKIGSTELEEALSGYVQSTDLTNKLATKADKTDLEDYVEQTEFDTLEGTVTSQGVQITSIQESLNDKVGDAELTEKLSVYTLKSDFDKHTQNEIEDVLHVTQEEKTGWTAKVDTTLLNQTVETGDNAVKTELKKEIETVKSSIPKVDTTYTSSTFDTSLNAQSGKSVKGALDKFHDDIIVELTGGDISLEGYATSEELEAQKTELEIKITKAQTAAEGAQSTADTAKTNAATAQSAADAAQSELDEHIAAEDKHVSATEKQQWNNKVDIAGLTLAINEAKTAIKTEYEAAINKAVGTVFKWKGTVDSYSDLTDKEETAEVGDVYNVTDKDGANYVWSGDNWDKLSENLEGFATDNDLTTHTNNNNIHFNVDEKTQWDTTIKGHTTSITELNEQVSSHGTEIGKLQQKDEELAEQITTKAEVSELTKYALASDVEELTTTVESKANTTDLTKHTGDTKIHFSSQTEKSSWKTDIDNNKSNLTTLQGEVTAHTGNDSLHFTKEEKETWETNITNLQSTTQTTSTELSALQGTVESEQSKLKKHIDDVTVAHFSGTEKSTMQSNISALQTQITKKVEQSAIDTAVANLATTASVTKVAGDLQDFIDSVDHEWSSAESPKSTAPQSGEAVAAAVQEHEKKSDIHVTAEEKESWATQEYVNQKTSGLATSGNIQSLTEQVTQAQDDLESHTQDTSVHFDTGEKTTWTGKITKNEKAIETASASISDALNKYETLSEEVEGIQTALQSKADATELASKADVSVTNRLQTKLTEVEKKIPEVEKTYNGETFAESTNVPTGEVVSDAIDAALSSYATSSSVTEAVNAAKSALTTEIGKKADNTALQNHIQDDTAHFTDSEKEDWETQLTEATTNISSLQTSVGTKIGNTELQAALKSYTTTEALNVLLADKVGNTEFGQLQDKVEQCETTEHATKTYATKKEVTALDTEVKLKATSAEVQALTEQVEDKIDQGQLDTALEAYTKTTDLTKQLADKADDTDITRLEGLIGNKADKDALSAIESKIPKVDDKWTTATSGQSKNAQSGVAVKGAIDELSTNLSAQITAVEEQLSDYATASQLEQQNTDLTSKIKEAKDTADAAQTDATAANTAVSKAQADATKANTAITTHEAKSDIHVTTSQKSTWDAKIDQDGLDSAIGTAKSEIQQEYQEAINTAVGSVFTWKGNIDNLESLKAVESPKTGDVYNVTEEDGANYVYTGSEEPSETGGWDKLSENISGLASKNELDTHKSDSEAHFTTGQKTTWQNDISTAKTNISNLQDQVSEIESNYLDKTEAGTTYLKITEASSTYLTISQANSTYLKSAEAEMDYVKKTDFNELQTRVDTNTSNYEELQKTVEALQTRLQILENTAVTSTTTKKIEVYTNPTDAPELSEREEGTLYLVGDGEQ